MRGGVFWFEGSQKAAGKMRAVYVLRWAIKTCVCKQGTRALEQCRGEADRAGFIGLRVASSVGYGFIVRLGTTLPYMPLLETLCALSMLS